MLRRAATSTAPAVRRLTPQFSEVVSANSARSAGLAISGRQLSTAGRPEQARSQGYHIFCISTLTHQSPATRRCGVVGGLRMHGRYSSARPISGLPKGTFLFSLNDGFPAGHHKRRCNSFRRIQRTWRASHRVCHLPAKSKPSAPLITCENMHFALS